MSDVIKNIYENYRKDLKERGYDERDAAMLTVADILQRMLNEMRIANRL